MKRIFLVAILPVLLLGPAWAEDPVHFSDSDLKAAVEAELWISDPTPTDMLLLTGLTHKAAWDRSDAISNLTGLGYALNLAVLDLENNDVSNLSPIAGLDQLQILDLSWNRVSNVSPLAGLPNLSRLELHQNPVSDVSPLTSLTTLTYLGLRNCPLSREFYDTVKDQIEASNPGVRIDYFDLFQGQLVISSSIGGSVVSPGEGTFTVEFGEVVSLEARADPGYVFVGWTGTESCLDNPWELRVESDVRVQANFISTLRMLYVDDDAPGDPGPNDPAASDPHENGTEEHPFDSVSEAIEVADKEATIFVHAGTYRECIDLRGKPIEITGFDPNDPNQAFWPVIDGDGKGPVVRFSQSKDESSLLTGLVITGGKGRTASAIQCAGSHPTIANCIITGNRVTEYDGAPVSCTDSKAVFINCTIVGNRGGQYGAGLSSTESEITLANSILWGNYPKEITFEGGYTPAIRYSIVKGGWLGVDNLDADPLLADLGHWVDQNNPAVTVSGNSDNAAWLLGDYHLQSQAGRWDPLTSDWVNDPLSSPCIDAGDPAAPVGHEPPPNGGLLNMGAYGGTGEASKSDY